MNCEDVAMQFLVANVSGRPPLFVRSSLGDLGVVGARFAEIRRESTRFTESVAERFPRGFRESPGVLPTPPPPLTLAQAASPRAAATWRRPSDSLHDLPLDPPPRITAVSS